MSEMQVLSENVVARKNDEHASAQLLDTLRKLWIKYDRRGLEIRHQTGADLNTHLGPPSERQRYGATVLKKFSEGLNLSVSDLSRMRWFAHRFSSIKELQAQHPEVSTWTDVKNLLVKLGSEAVKPASAEDNQKTSQAKRSIRYMIRAVQAVQKYAAGVGKLTRDGDDWTTLDKELREMIEAVENCLGVRYRSDTTPSLGIDVKIPMIDQAENGFLTCHEVNASLEKISMNA